MIAAVDVQYDDQTAGAACVLFESWTAGSSVREVTRRIDGIAPYEPGQFFKRELPCILNVLKGLSALDAVVIDGFVWLSADEKPGLGAHLFDALGGETPVVGVAKTPFAGAAWAKAVVRGSGAIKPLYVTAAGIELAVAADHIKQMHGPFRVPTMLRQVDMLARSTVRLHGV